MPQISEREQIQLRKYLLDQLSEIDEELVELRLLTDDGYYEEFELIENELMDQYVQKVLSLQERVQFEKHVLQAPYAEGKLAFAIALHEESSRRALTKEKVVSLDSKRPLPIGANTGLLKNAAVVFFVIGLGFVLWILLGPKSDLDEGMVALNNAYKDQRLVEARISGLNYAPLRQTRGNEKPYVDIISRDRAQRLLLDAVFTRGDAASYHALGRFYLTERNFLKARQQFDEALKFEDNDASLHNDMAATLMELGKTERSTEPGTGLQYFAQSLEHVNRALQLNGSLLEALFNSALLREEMKLFPEAQQAWRKYLEKDSTSLWADEARNHLHNLEQLATRTSRRSSDLFQAFEAGYYNHDRSSVWAAISVSQSRLGNTIVERLVSDYLLLSNQRQTAAAQLKLGMLKFGGEVQVEKVGDRYLSDLADFYGRVGNRAYQPLNRARKAMAAGHERYNVSEFEAAILHYSEARYLFESVGDTSEALFADSWVGYGQLRLPGGDTRDRFDRLAKIYQIKKYRSLQAQAIHALSDASTDDNALSKALDLAGVALNISEEIEDDATRMRCLQQFVSINLKFGRYLESLKYGMTAIEIAQSYLNEPKLIWTFYHEMALDFYWLKLPEAALEFENRALQLAKDSGWPYIITRSYTQLGILYEKRRDYGEAIKNGMRALSEAQNVQGTKSRATILSHAEMRLGHIYRASGDFEKGIEHYNTALSLYEQLNLGVFLYEVHKGKFMALAALGRVPVAGEEIATTLRLFEQFRPKIQEERNRNSFFDVGNDTYDLAIDFAYSKLSDPVKAFDYAEQSRARSLLDNAKSLPKLVITSEGSDLVNHSLAHPFGLEQLRSRLPESVQIVEYYLCTDKVIAWVITRETFESRITPISSLELQRKVADYVDEISNANRLESGSKLSRELYGLLIKPIELLLDTRRQVCIVPDKGLANLPFVSLRSPDDGKFLLEKYTTLSSPSASVFLICTESARIKENFTPERVLSVGNPSFSHKRFPELPDLRDAEREARDIAGMYNNVAVLGSGARERAVTAAIQKVEIIHFASHFLMNQQVPMLSGLVLAESGDNTAANDGVLQVSEIYAMKLPRARLVVLSACETGTGRTYEGEGTASIARSFISAGVPMVIASLWPVESETAADLMIKVHHNRKTQGLSTALALRNAQLDLLSRARQEKRETYAWAGFSLFGGYAEF